MYAFVHIEKTAGSTLLGILRHSYGSLHCDIRLPLAKRGNEDFDHRECITASDLQSVCRIYRHLRGFSGHNVKAYSDIATHFPEVRFFTFVRDPIKRFLSHFYNRGPGCSPQAFDQWISAEWTHNWQTKMIAGEANAERAIELLDQRFGLVGISHRFDEGLLLLKQWMNDRWFNPEHRSCNRISDKWRPRDIARREADMSYLETPETRARLEAANAEDQKVFDYVSQQIYPRQVATYVGDLTADVEAFRLRNATSPRPRESIAGSVMRNYIYKPLLHCRVV